MAGKSPGGLAEVKEPRTISTEVLKINGLADTRPVTHHQHSPSSPDPTTSGPGTAGKTRLCSSSDSIDDERRLLPGNYIDDPEAVLIGRPQTKSAASQMAGGVISGGPRPTNTLGSKPYEFSSAVSGMTNGLKRTVGAVGTLITKTTFGDNVKRLNGRGALTDLTAERDAKRPKLGSSNRSQDSVKILDGDDDVDMLSAEKAHVSRQRSPQGKNRTPSLLSQQSNPNLTSVPSLDKYVNEYRTVESTMDSSPGGRKGTHGQYNGHSSTSNMSANNVPSSVIDLSGDDAPRKAISRWKGAARPSASRAGVSVVPNHSGRGRQTGYTSDHFKKPKSSEKAFDLTGKRYISTAENTEEGSRRDPNLRDSFIQSDGLRRNSNISLSSDELQSEPYDTVTRVSSRRQTGHGKPPTLHVEGATKSEHFSTGLPQSNIPSTTFSASRRNVAPRKSLASGAQQRTRDTPFGVPIISFNYGGLYYEVAKGQNPGLAGNELDRSLDVYVDGCNITERSPGRRIQPEKLQKITWAQSSRKMRLEFSKCGTDDGKVDLELGSEKDVAKLLQYLQTSSPRCKVVDKPSETLDKMFKMRSSEQRAHRRSGEGGSKWAIAEMAPIEARKQRGDGASQSPELPKHPRSKRRPTDSRLIAQLSRSKRQTLSDLRSGNLSDDHGSEGSVRASEPGVAKHLRKKKQAEESSTNPHVTRSAVPRIKLSPSPFEGVAPNLRYSKTHDLGPRWSKPLIYPKVGKKKTTVEYVDIERLDEGEFLNDNLIGFYLRILECQLEQKDPDLAKTIYFFNTYFFASLTNTPRGKRGINYEAVQKWTRSVDLFQYDYVVVPINESAHWYVAIICNLPFINRSGGATNDETTASPNIAQITERDASDDRPASPLQQARPNTVKEDVFTSLEMELEKPDEQATRDSFAEMNLGDGMDKPPHGLGDSDTMKHRRSAVDKGEEERSVIARDHANMDMAEPAANGDEDIGNGQDEETLEQAGEVQGLPLKAPVSVRRGKRKSFPPPKVSHPDQPTIITLDSLGLAHAPTVRILKDYLHEEGKTKRDGMEWEDTQIKGMTAKQIPLQDNFCDCGLFLLGYVEKFLEDPRGFVSRTLRREFNEKKDWPDMVPSQLRSNIRELILRLHMEEKRESAIRAGKYRGSRQQIPALTTTDTAQPGKKAADVGDAALPTALGNRIKPIPGAECTKDDRLEDAVTVDEQDPSAGPDVLPSKSGTVEEAQVHPESNHKVRAANLGSKDSTPIVLDSQSQGQSTHQQVDPEPADNGDITATVPESPSEVPTTAPGRHVRDDGSRRTNTNDSPISGIEWSGKRGSRRQQQVAVVIGK
ncbi:MAG: Ulp1 protease [Lasallia pustulata]|uniref:Ulp1 protease n=1 Tax=Lasallia pustulata TaxID=136370 RepID=A0A5M8PVM9_9LECA|nr:MAG: Ulp1 protease [Lasallia pustulata]